MELAVALCGCWSWKNVWLWQQGCTDCSTFESTIRQPKHAFGIVEQYWRSDKENLERKLKTALASSLWVDGSVDRVQIDKIYVLLKIINADGEPELIFLGIGEQITSGASGLFDAVKKGIIDNIGESLYETVMLSISSICTDGTNVNSGERGGLWKFIEDEVRRIKSVIPVTKVWCNAHQQNGISMGRRQQNR